MGPGEVLLGKYRIERVLGRGGMGLVVAARHLTLDDRVAIKVLLPETVPDARVVERFVREARAAVRVRSQHIVRVNDVGTLENGAPYMVMEYLEGSDLAGMSGLPIAQVVDYVLQACEALAEAHAQGIVHRDIKPSNLFLTHLPDGSPCVKVLDFGISKLPDTHALTRTGGVLGSPLYMSPEQLRSARDVDARADIYSMGVVLFELLTGKQPFVAEELAQLIYKVMHDAPEMPRALRPDIPEALEEVILAAIARDREQRFGTVAELAIALAPFGSSAARDSALRCCTVMRLDPMAPRSSRRDLTLTMAPLGKTYRPPAASWKVAPFVAFGLVAVASVLVFALRAPRAMRATAAGVRPNPVVVPAPPSAPPPLPVLQEVDAGAPPKAPKPVPAPRPAKPSKSSDPFRRDVF